MEHEYYPYQETPPAELFYKVSHGSGRIATASAAAGKAATESESQQEVELPEATESGVEVREPIIDPELVANIDLSDPYHRKSLARTFPELHHASTETITTILHNLPDIVQQGWRRFDARQQVEHEMRMYYEWLGGKKLNEIAAAEGYANFSKVSERIASLLRALKSSFTLEELLSGQIIEDTEQIYFSNARSLLEQAFYAEDVATLKPEQIKQIMDVLIATATPKNQFRFTRILEGQLTREIAARDRVTPLAIAEWRRRYMGVTVARSIDYEILKAALDSKNPEKELQKIFSKIHMVNQYDQYGKPATDRRPNKSRPKNIKPKSRNPAIKKASPLPKTSREDETEIVDLEPAGEKEIGVSVWVEDAS